MNKILRLTILAAIVTALLVALIPTTNASAAELDAATTKMITITEAQINASYRVTNPRNRAVTNVYVAVQQGQVAISATITEPGKAPLNTVSNWQPYIVHGLVEWKLISATVNGQPASQDLIDVLQALHKTALRTTLYNLYRRLLTPRSYVIAVQVAPGAITITVQTYTRPTPTPTN